MKIYNEPHAVSELAYHIIWCTKYRHQVLKNAVEIELKKLIAEACEHYGWKLEMLETMPDHVHIFVRADHTVAPVEIAKTLKSLTAVQLFTAFPALKEKKFWGSGLWGRSTYYGSVGNVSADTIKNYIANQKEAV